jgi:hypothetical protein
MNRADILTKLASGAITQEEAEKLLDNLEAKKGGLYCKVSEKKALSVYGLQRMPVTLYAEQWERLLDYADEIRKFIVENNSAFERRKR